MEFHQAEHKASDEGMTDALMAPMASAVASVSSQEAGSGIIAFSVVIWT